MIRIPITVGSSCVRVTADCGGRGTERCLPPSPPVLGLLLLVSVCGHDSLTPVTVSLQWRQSSWISQYLHTLKFVAVDDMWYTSVDQWSYDEWLLWTMHTYMFHHNSCKNSVWTNAANGRKTKKILHVEALCFLVNNRCCLGAALPSVDWLIDVSTPPTTRVLISSGYNILLFRVWTLLYNKIFPWTIYYWSFLIWINLHSL